MRNSKHATGEPVDSIVLVTFARVAPVDNVHSAVGAVVEIHAAKPGVGCKGDVGLVAGDVAGTLALQSIDVDPAAVEIERQQFAAVFGGPVVAQIDAGAAVGVAAAELVVNAQTLGVFDALAGVPMK